MKERLDKASKEALIAYRLQRAHDTLSEARLLMDASFFNAATNRLYYACYYASVALLLKHDLQSQSHKGVKALLGLHFVSTGLLPVKVGKVLSTLFEKRQSGDYDDFVYCDKEMLDELYPQAEFFVDSVERLIKEEN